MIKLVIMLKHDKYVYIEVKRSLNEKKEEKFYVKARSFKAKDYNSPDRYVIVGIKKEKPPRGASVIKVDDVPLEIKEKLLGNK